MTALRFVWYLGVGPLVETLIFLPLCLIALVLISPVYLVLYAWEKAHGRELRQF
jgi:hypothetical protein